MSTRTFVVRVSDEITIERYATLLVEAEDAEGAEEAARERLRRFGDVELDEEQIDATPWEVEVYEDSDGDRLAELLAADRDRPGPLDADERAELQRLRDAFDLRSNEVLYFKERKP